MTDLHFKANEYDSGKINKLYFLIYFLISIPFIVLFYDTFNLNANIFSTENLILGLNPYSHQSLLVIGFTALPYNYFLTWFYNVDGFNAYLVVIIIKLIAMIFTIGSAFLIYKILLILKVSYKKAKIAMLGYLFSPFIIFVDYIWVQPEFYSIFFILLGIYVFEKYNVLRGKFVDLIVISFSLLIAGITFYFPLLLVPSYLIYIKGKIPKVKFFAALIISGTAFLLPILLFNLKTTFSSTLAGKNVNIFPYSLISLFLTSKDPIGEIELFVEASFIILSFLIPLLMFRYKKSIYLSQLILLSILFSFQITGINPDTFIFLIPFIIIEYSLLERSNFSFWKIIFLQMILLPEYINLQLLNGPGYVTGIYYWIYFWYHKNVVILGTIPYRQLITQILNALTFVLMYYLIFYLIWFSKNKRTNNHKMESYESHNNQSSMSTDKKFQKTSINLITVAIVFLLLISSVPLSNSHTTSTLEIKNKLPTMLYMSNDPQNSQYIMQNKNTYLYFSHNNTLSFFSGNVITYLYKNISNENYKMMGNLSFKNPDFIVRPQEVFQLGNSFAGITKYININKSTQQLHSRIGGNTNYSILPYTESLGCYFLASPGTKIIQLNGNSYYESFLNYSLLVGKTALLMVGIQNYQGFSSPILEIKLGSTCNELYFANSSFYFGQKSSSVNEAKIIEPLSSSFQSMKLNGKNISVSWNLIGVSFVNSSTGSLILDGIEIPMVFDNIDSMNSTILTIGEPQTGNKSSLMGRPSLYATDIYLITQNTPSFSPGLFSHRNETTNITCITHSNSLVTQVPFTINATGNISTLILGNLSVKTFNHASFVAFGQINTASVSFNMKVSLVKIQKKTQTINYNIVILIFAIILPLSVFIIFAIDNYRNKRS